MMTEQHDTRPLCSCRDEPDVTILLTAVHVCVLPQASVNLYLDVINLFLYILQLLGRHQRS